MATLKDVSRRTMDMSRRAVKVNRVGTLGVVSKRTMEVSRSLVLQSMRLRERGVQAPSNIAGFKIENTNFNPYFFSEI